MKIQSKKASALIALLLLLVLITGVFVFMPFAVRADTTVSADVYNKKDIVDVTYHPHNLRFLNLDRDFAPSGTSDYIFSVTVPPSLSSFYDSYFGYTLTVNLYYGEIYDNGYYKEEEDKIYMHENKISTYVFEHYNRSKSYSLTYDILYNSDIYISMLNNEKKAFSIVLLYTNPVDKKSYLTLDKYDYSFVLYKNTKSVTTSDNESSFSKFVGQLKTWRYVIMGGLGLVLVGSILLIVFRAKKRKNKKRR